MKRKPRLSKVLGMLLLICGLALLLYPMLSDRLTMARLRRDIGHYNQVTAAEKADYSALWAAAEEYNGYLLKKDSRFIVEQEEREWVETLLNPLGTNLMGYVDIPRLGVELPLYQGTNERQLQSGAGWWVGSSLPTGGTSTHCVITAHTGLVKAKLFTDLDQMELGDTFTVTVLDRELLYCVDQILVTEPSDIRELYITEGEDYFTLYTCTPYGVNTQRILVRGARVLERVDALTDTRLAPMRLAVALMLPCLMALGGGFVLWRRRRKGGKQHPKDEGNDI